VGREWYGLLILLTAAPLAYGGPSADGVFVPPTLSKSLADASPDALPADLVAYYVSKVGTRHVFRDFEGWNDILKAASSDGKVLRVAETLPVNLDADALFAAPFADGLYQVFLAGVTSVDALALRLRVDLSMLAGGQETWVLDPNGPRAFGPYFAGDDVPGGLWLATVTGDTAVLMVRSSSADVPRVRLNDLAHFYRGFEDLKELSCNIDVACNTNSMIQQIATAVGLVLIPREHDTIAASGALMNIPATPQLEPFFLTANHVIADAATAQNTDVVWDFRATQCGANDAGSITSLPHSRGVELLATSATLDTTLIRLDSVSLGKYGRAYLGWDTRKPRPGDNVFVIHHPQAKRMRITYGRVAEVDMTVVPYVHETLVGWDAGVTEPGSSGSCLLYSDGTCRIAGMLSGGSQAECGAGPTENYDYFSSFPTFFMDISPAYLTGANGNSRYRPPQTAKGEGEGEGEGEPGPGCAGAALTTASGTPPATGSPGDVLGWGVLVTLLLLATAVGGSAHVQRASR
jgi:hypothetical protein